MSDRISRLLLPGDEDAFEYETRKKGIGIVPEAKAAKSKLTGEETKKVGLGIETKFGDISTSATKSKDRYGEKKQKSLDYKFARRFGKGKRSKAELYAKKSMGSYYGDKLDNYEIGGKLRYEIGGRSTGGLMTSRGGRAAIRGIKFTGVK
tara:strand:+ start:196 stop:645 length:450 start_codon:yes stop_codon:yes gene_type:complete